VSWISVQAIRMGDPHGVFPVEHASSNGVECDDGLTYRTVRSPLRIASFAQCRLGRSAHSHPRTHTLTHASSFARDST